MNLGLVRGMRSARLLAVAGLAIVLALPCSNFTIDCGGIVSNVLLKSKTDI
jgi:hypothetical protein